MTFWGLERCRGQNSWWQKPPHWINRRWSENIAGEDDAEDMSSWLVQSAWQWHWDPCTCVTEAHFSTAEFCSWGGGAGLNPEVKQWTRQWLGSCSGSGVLHYSLPFWKTPFLIIGIILVSRGKQVPERQRSLLFSCPFNKTEIWINIWFRLPRPSNSFCHVGDSQIVHVSEKLEGVHFFCIVSITWKYWWVKLIVAQYITSH